jgi:plastocyanin
MAVYLLIIGSSLSIFFLYAIAPAEQQSGKVEIVIRNSTYEFQGGTLRPDESSTIVLRNLDAIEHGFTSTLLEELNVRVETGGVTTFGKGIKGVHINAGQTVLFRFIPTRPGKFSFQCDLHPSMKGELLVLSVGAI